MQNFNGLMRNFNETKMPTKSDLLTICKQTALKRRPGVICPSRLH